MKKMLAVVSLAAVLLSPAGAWAGGYGHYHHHHDHDDAEYLALGVLGGVLGGIVLGSAISGNAHYYLPPPPRPVYVPRPAYYGPVYVPVYPRRRHGCR